MDRGYAEQWEPGEFSIESVNNKHFPAKYKVKGKKHIYYEPQLQTIRPAKSDLEKGYFIEKTKKVAERSLRGGRKRKYKTLYLLKAWNDPTVHRFIEGEELNTLVKRGLFSIKDKNG